MTSHRFGTVALLGPPNAGKSSLVNKIIGEDLAGVCSKAQTTRKNLRAIFSDKNSQIVFLDTPGIIDRPPKHLDCYFDEQTYLALKNCDLIALVLGVKQKLNIGQKQKLQFFLEEFSKKPKLIIFTQADLLKPNQKINLSSFLVDFEKIPATFFSIFQERSAPKLISFLQKHLPEGPAFYPDDDLTDSPLYLICQEKIRAIAADFLEKEIPYQLAVQVLSYDDEKNRATLFVDLVVARKSQKAIVIGHQAKMVKKIGIQARKALMEFLQKKVTLKLNVKVDTNWHLDRKKMAEYGYFLTKSKR